MLKQDISGIFLVAGTSIGGAMLALPMTAVRLGLVMTGVYLVMVAIIMCISGLLLMPLYGKYGPVSIVGLAKKRLGAPWDWLATLALALLLYSLLVAYLSGLSNSFASITGFPWKACLIVITFLLVISLTLSNKLIDFYNKIAFSSKIILLLGVFIILGQTFELSKVQTSLMPVNSGFLISLPILVTSFGFHGSAAFLFKLLGPVAYKKAVIRGISLTFIIYFLWIFLILGLVPHEQILSVNLEEFLSLLDSMNDNGYLMVGLKIFYNLAIATSLFGVSVGLFDFLEEKFPKKNRLFLSGMVFLIPMFCNFLNKNLFFQALNFAGIALTFIAIILPSLIALKDKSINRFLLIFLLIFSLLVSFGEIITVLAL
jgi:tyrosine-specific transport protein